jgi:hypothetical protein
MMSATISLERPALAGRTRLIFLALAVAGIVAAGVGALTSPHDMWANLLLVGYYAVTLGLGGLFFIAVEYASGSTWSIAIRRIPEAMTRLIPAGAVVIFAVLVTRPELYPWTSGNFGGTAESALDFKQAWLNRPLFLARAAGYAAIWTFFAWAIPRQSRLQDSGGQATRTYTNRKLSLAFLVLFALTFSLAAFDWIMSMEPGWFSTIFAVYNFAGLFLSTLAAIVVLTIWLERGTMAGVITDSHVHDLGKLFFGMSTFWMYIWFSQYMLIWYANIPEETTYFVDRMHGGWLNLLILNVILNWAVPFLVLMRKRAKLNRRVLLSVALTVLVGRWLDLYLMIFPYVTGASPRIGPFELGLAAGGIGLCGLALTAALRAAPVVAVGDPQLSQSLQYHS